VVTLTPYSLPNRKPVLSAAVRSYRYCVIWRCSASLSLTQSMLDTLLHPTQRQPLPLRHANPELQKGLNVGILREKVVNTEIFGVLTNFSEKKGAWGLPIKKKFFFFFGEKNSQKNVFFGKKLTSKHRFFGVYFGVFFALQTLPETFPPFPES